MVLRLRTAGRSPHDYDAGRAADSVAQAVRLERGSPLAHFSVYLGTTRHGTARVTGKVLDEGHRPVRAARIRADVSDNERVSSIDGSLVLEHLPAGTHAISARAVGFSPRDAAIKFDDGGTAAMDLSLAKPTVLSAVVSRAVATEANTAAFEEHGRRVSAGSSCNPSESKASLRFRQSPS